MSYEVTEEERSSRVHAPFQSRGGAEDYAGIRVDWYRQQGWQLVYDTHNEAMLTLTLEGESRTVTIRVVPRDRS